MTVWIPLWLRGFVSRRAKEQCEYCRFPQASSWLTFEMEHIVSQKHGGQSNQDNLALACPDCNRFKGSDLGSLDPQTGELTPFFNPRLHTWEEHFRMDDGVIVPLSAEARVTVPIFQINLPERIAERKRLIATGEYPV